MSARDIRIDVDLGQARNAAQMFAETQNVPFTSFTVVSISPGATMSLGAGQGAPLFPMQAGDRWEVDDPRCDPPIADGLFITNTSQPGATAIIQVGAGAHIVRGL